MRLANILRTCVLLALGATIAAVPARTNAPSGHFSIGMLSVERFGNPKGHAVIMIPGLFCGTWEFNGQIAALAKRNDIYAVTLPGMDGRPRDTGGRLVERATASIHALIQSRKLVAPIVVGHSLGGTLAVSFGESYPDDAGAIISLEGGMPIAATASQRVASADAQARRYENADAKTFDKVLRTTLLQYTITSPADVDAVAPLAERTDPNAAADWFRAALSLDLTPNLYRIHVPLTEIVPFDPNIDPYQGYKTLAAKKSAARAFVSHTPRGQVIMISPSRHFEMFDQPRAINAALRSLIP